MAPGGWLYTITDVPELGEWMVSRVGCTAGLLGWCVAWDDVVYVGSGFMCLFVQVVMLCVAL